MRSNFIRWSIWIFCLSLSCTVAVCQADPAVGAGSNCQVIGPTVIPPTNPWEGTTQLPKAGEAPKTPISCTPPKTPIYSASNVVLAPSTNNPPKPEINKTPPLAPTASNQSKKPE